MTTETISTIFVLIYACLFVSNAVHASIHGNAQSQIVVKSTLSKTSKPWIMPRGGFTSTDDEIEDKESAELLLKQKAMQKYKINQYHLLQLRSTFLSELLASRGVPVGPTMADVCTSEGNKPPESCDWDCCLSTVDDPKTCLYSFDAEPNTKVLSPSGTTQFISLSALNRLRRTDPTKVEPMWHSRYSILKSWFSDESEFSILQFVGWKGFLVSSVLLDMGKGMVLRALLSVGVFGILITLMPLLEYLITRILVSSLLWMRWKSWGKIVHAALPLKLLIAQMTWKFMAGSFAKLEGKVREYVVDLECAILEECIPITVGN